MKIGFIGAGKAGCSLGKYFLEYSKTLSDSQNQDKQDGELSKEQELEQYQIEVTGYYSLIEEEAIWAAQFTDSHYFRSVEELIAASDSIIVSTPDGVIASVWETLDKSKISGKVICHLSGSLSSDVFSGCGDYGAYPISIHPMFAFSNKESVYRQLKNVCFTLEGHPCAVTLWEKIFALFGNATVKIDKSVKTKYHAAASLLSNHVLAVLQMGYEMLMDCGFCEREARSFSEVLVRENVEHMIKDGATGALTGPIERADMETVKKHLSVMNEEQQEMYKVCGRKLTEIAKQKNPNRDYGSIEKLL